MYGNHPFPDSPTGRRRGANPSADGGFAHLAGAEFWLCPPMLQIRAFR